MKKNPIYEINDSVVAWGKEALVAEADAIKNTAAELGPTFIEAVKIILCCEGKVATTGLGKSGHIARKVSATFSSTGTSSYFIHPSEALHGDFGMLNKEDCLLAFAYGGETKEVVDVVNYARRLGVKIVAITGKPNSSLAQSAHCVLNGGVNREACPLGLAPTSSSTVALALGDALAVSVMRSKGFREEDFASLHPGGSLGRKLSLIKEHMRKTNEIGFVKKDASFSEVLKSITNPNFGIIGVIDDRGSLVGAVTDGDIRRALVKFGEKIILKKAEEFMALDPKMIDEKCLALDAVAKMEELKITSLFVNTSREPTKAVGLVRMHDLIEAKVV